MNNTTPTKKVYAVEARDQVVKRIYVEAESEEHALEIGEEVDGGEFEYWREGSWDITKIVEYKPQEVDDELMLPKDAYPKREK